MSDRMFPLQTSRRKGIVPGPVQIPWSVAEKAYGAYAAQYGKGQSLERLAERGGFGWCEMDDLYPAWREEISVIAALRDELARVNGHLKTMIADSCDDREAMAVLCRKAGIPDSRIDGDSYGVPGIMDLADMLAAKLAAAVAERDELLEALQPFANFANFFDESVPDNQLVWFDDECIELSRFRRAAARASAGNGESQ